MTRRRGAGLQAFTLLLSMLITGTAMTLLNMQASNRRLHESLTGSLQSQLLCETGLEWVRHNFQNNPNWRSSISSGDPITVKPVAGQTILVTLFDSDDDFADDDTQPATLKVTGKQGGATASMKGLMTPHHHEALDYAVYMSGTIDMRNTVMVTGLLHAGVSVDALPNPANITTDRITTADCVKINKSLHLNTVFEPPTGEPAPSPDAAFFARDGTELFGTDVAGELILEYGVFTSTTNSQGAANPSGIYYLNAGTQNVRIRNVLVEGTLVIATSPGATVWIEQGGLFTTGSLRYPVLMIAGGGALVNIDLSTQLVENDVKTPMDYNADGDTLDTLVSGLDGIFWTDATILAIQSSDVTFNGCMIGKTLNATVFPIFTYSPEVAAGLIHEFTDDKLHIEVGSLRMLRN